MDLNLKATELRLGLPGSDEPAKITKKRPLSDDQTAPPPAKSQIVGWPPVRSYRKNNTIPKSREIYVKVSMDGAPYLRKIDLTVYAAYPELLKALETMFKFTFSDYAPTYEDKDGDWMLVGDVPWDMFVSSCNKLRIMKGSEAKGLTTS